MGMDNRFIILLPCEESQGPILIMYGFRDFAQKDNAIVLFEILYCF